MDRFDCGLIELKLAGSSVDDMTFSGYGAVFGNVDSHGDMIQPGAFRDTLAEAKASGNMPAMLLEHGLGLTVQDGLPIGIWTDMHEDQKGLFVEGRIAPTPRGQEVHALMKMGAMKGLSIAYKAIKSTPGYKSGGPRRILEAVRLKEVSPVTFPSNDRSLVESVKTEMTKRSLERALRDAGCSQTEAKRILAQGFTPSTQRDVGGLDEIAETIRRNIQTIKA